MTLDDAINTPLREVNTYEADGKVHTLKEWAKILDTTVNVLYGRLLTHTMQEIYSNWKKDGKINVKICKKVLYTVNGETHCRAEWSRILGIPVSTLKYKLKKKTMEEIYNDVFGS